MNRRIALHFAVLILICAGPLTSTPVHAARPWAQGWQVASADDWNSLSDDQKQLLEKHRDHWNSYPPARRARLLRGVRRYQSLSPEEQARARRARRRFKRMSPEQRNRLRREYLRSRPMRRR
ncbi:MAG: DUF3106 domain-containing protein [Acidiferrobacterales bacterium]